MRGVISQKARISVVIVAGNYIAAFYKKGITLHFCESVVSVSRNTQKTKLQMLRNQNVQ